MKQYIFLIYILVLHQNLFAQKINVYENTDTLIVLGYRYFGLHNDVLFFDANRLNLNNLSDTTLLIKKDYTYYEINTFNTKTFIKNKYLVKSDINNFDICNTHTPYYNSEDGRYYFSGSEINIQTFNYNTSYDTVYKHFYIESYDTLLTNRKKIFLQRVNDTVHYENINNLFYKDSLVLSLAVDNSHKAYLCKNSLIDGHLIDTVLLYSKPFTTQTYQNSYYTRLDWLNDSVIVVLSDNIHYINYKQMKIIDTVTVYFDPNPYIKKWFWFNDEFKFEKKDSSYFFVSRDSFQFYYSKIKANGVAIKGIYNIPVADSFPNKQNNIGFGLNSWDYQYANHFYIGFKQQNSDSFAIVHINEKGITDWIRMFLMDIDSENLWNIHPVALSDSSVIVFLQGYIPGIKNFDYYYLKLDQNGNIINTPLGLTTPIKSINEIILYPNPSSNQVYIGNINLSTIQSIKIINANGQIIKALDPTLIIDVKDLPPNIYSIVIQTKEGVVSKQFQKQ